MRVIVTGGREYADKGFLFDILDRIHSKRPVSLLVEGGARGADALAREWANARDIPFKTVEANWERYGGRAGPVRNHKMLREEKPALVVAFIGRIGTPHMVAISRRAGVRVIETWKLSAG